MTSDPAMAHALGPGAPGTRVSLGNWTRRAWMGASYLVARRLDADGVSSHLVDRFGEE
jgi:branched-chain amino acid transport system substrate-binding protein